MKDLDQLLCLFDPCVSGKYYMYILMMLINTLSARLSYKINVILVSMVCQDYCINYYVINCTLTYYLYFVLICNHRS